MATFRLDPAHRFRGYLQTVVDNAIRTYWRVLSHRPGWVGTGGDGPDAVPEPLSTLGAELDDEIQERLGRVLREVDRVRFEVGPSAWGAFWLTTVDGLPAAQAGERLGMSAAAVYMAKSRVVRRLREQAGGPPGG